MYLKPLLLPLLLPVTVWAGTIPVEPVSLLGPDPNKAIDLRVAPVVRTYRPSRPAANSWTHPGNIRTHMLATHEIRSSEASGLSDSDLEWVHSRSHDILQSWGYGNGSGAPDSKHRQATLAALGEMGVTAEKVSIFAVVPANHSAAYRSGYSYGSSCPGGVCPAPQLTGAQKRAMKRAEKGRR